MSGVARNLYNVRLQTRTNAQISYNHTLCIRASETWSEHKRKKGKSEIFFYRRKTTTRVAKEKKTLRRRLHAEPKKKKKKKQKEKCAGNGTEWKEALLEWRDSWECKLFTCSQAICCTFAVFVFCFVFSPFLVRASGARKCFFSFFSSFSMPATGTALSKQHILCNALHNLDNVVVSGDGGRIVA